MNIVVGSIQQETNSFSPISPRMEDFDTCYGDRMLGRVAATRVFEKAGASIIPTIYANAVPSGRVPLPLFERLCNELLSRIPTDIQIDGVWLYLHGAMDVDGIGSGDAAIVERVRQKVGPKVPIAVALDFHANNDPRMVDHANVICGYRTAPHRDMEETQTRAANLLLECVSNAWLPKPVLVHIPLMITGDMALSDYEPLKGILAEAIESEKKPGMLTVSVFHGQNWVDSPNAGASVIAIGREDPAPAASEAKRLARIYWRRRKEFRFQANAFAPEEALSEALAARRRLVFVSDSGDNTTAGAAGESTQMLRLAISAGAKSTLIGGITAPMLLESAREKHEGSRIDLRLDDGSTVEATIRHKGDILGWGGENAGPAIVTSVGGVDVIFTRNRCAMVKPSIFQSVGVDIFSYNVVVVKLGYLYPDLAQIASRSILSLTDGASCEAIERLHFSNIRRPVYPMEDFEWDPDGDRGAI
jgi:microcystin degradation protein MlrC